jgi:hypothetical protein
MVMGLGLWKSFGRKNGITVGRIDFKTLLKHQLKEITGNDSGIVQSAVDQLIEGLGQMVSSLNFFIKHDFKTDGNELIIALNKIFPDFKRYASQTQFEGDILDSKSYRKLFDDTDYIVDKNRPVSIGGKSHRCIAIDIAKAKAAGVDLEGFGV